MTIDPMTIDPMTIDDVIRDFATTGSTLPRASMQWALDNWDEAYPRFAALLEAYARGADRTEETEKALFFVIYLMADKGEKRAFRTLCSILRDGETPERLIGDGVTEDLERILVAMFDGSGDALKAVIEDADADEYVRHGVLVAMAYLTRTGHVTDDEMHAYLRHLFVEMQPQDTCYVWVGWQSAVSLLGYEDLTEEVEQVFEREFVKPGVMEIRHFREDLRRTLDDPERMASFKHDRIGPYADAIGSLSRWYYFSDKYKADQARYAAERDDEDGPDLDLPPPDILLPRINPLRHIGRNDPCPCGSGKKFKKCCLPGIEAA